MNSQSSLLLIDGGAESRRMLPLFGYIYFNETICSASIHVQPVDRDSMLLASAILSLAEY